MRRYGIVLLVIECMGASTVLTYGLWLLFHPVQEDFEEDPHKPGMPKVHLSCQDPKRWCTCLSKQEYLCSSR